MRISFRLALAGTLTLACVIAAGCGKDKPGRAAFPDSLVDTETIVTLNTVPIVGRDLRVFTLLYSPGSKDSLRSRLFNVELLSGYIDRELLFNESRSNGIAITDSTVRWYVGELERTLGGDASMQRFLAETGIAREELLRTIRRDLAVRAYIEGPLAGTVVISPADAKAFYDANAQRFAARDSVRARHIILRGEEGEDEASRVDKRARLEDLRKRAQAGESFAELARNNSEGPSNVNGGDLGYFAYEDMVESFSQVAFALKKGQVSDVVETPFGLHIIQVVDHKTPERQVTFEDVQPRIVTMLQQQRLSQELENHLKRNRAAAIIEPHFDFGGLTQRESTTFTR